MHRGIYTSIVEINYPQLQILYSQLQSPETHYYVEVDGRPKLYRQQCQQIIINKSALLYSHTICGLNTFHDIPQGIKYFWNCTGNYLPVIPVLHSSLAYDAYWPAGRPCSHCLCLLTTHSDTCTCVRFRGDDRHWVWPQKLTCISTVK